MYFQFSIYIVKKQQFLQLKKKQKTKNNNNKNKKNKNNNNDDNNDDNDNCNNNNNNINNNNNNNNNNKNFLLHLDKFEQNPAIMFILVHYRPPFPNGNSNNIDMNMKPNLCRI